MNSAVLIMGVGVVVLLVATITLFVLYQKTKNRLSESTTKTQSLIEELQQKSTNIALLNQSLQELQEFKNQIQNLQKEKKELENKVHSLSVENVRFSEKLNDFEGIYDKYEILQEQNIKDKNRIKELEVKMEESQKSYEEKIKILKNAKDDLKLTFENVANDILEKTNQKMVKNSEKTLNDIIFPLKKDILNFKERIETLGKEEAEKLGFLQNELKSLKDLSYKLSSDAQDLTRALKGETKKQGMWGEVVLERVLEMSGLREGSEYVREKSFVDDENKRYRPDVIVYLPQDRQVIVDAKTSLNAYSHYIKAEDEEQKKQYLLAHIKAIKNHIDVLAKKKYEDLEGVNSLDFVFIFVPIENALMLALENDVELFEYAFRKRVILVSPTTLLVSLRSIESSWRSERQAKNIAEVVHSAEKLYDKVRGFVEDFDKIGKHIENSQKVYESAKNKLISGRGNVIRQIESLKQKAGIKPKTEIPKEYNLDLIESEK